MKQPLLGVWIIAIKEIVLALHMKPILEQTKRLVSLIKFWILDIVTCHWFYNCNPQTFNFFL